jgi:hypothetical protein
MSDHAVINGASAGKRGDAGIKLLKNKKFQEFILGVDR